MTPKQPPRWWLWWSTLVAVSLALGCADTPTSGLAVFIIGVIFLAAAYVGEGPPPTRDDDNG